VSYTITFYFRFDDDDSNSKMLVVSIGKHLLGTARPRKWTHQVCSIKTRGTVYQSSRC